MGWIWLIVVVAGGIFLWGVISPRSQWQLLQGWAFRNPEANEPSDAAYALTRIGSAVSIVVLLVAAFNLQSLTSSDDDKGAPAMTPVKAAWGSVIVSIVNRTFTPLPAPSGTAGVTMVELAGYSSIDPEARTPEYVWDAFDFMEMYIKEGLIGQRPAGGKAIDTADLVVGVTMGFSCFPREAVVREGIETIVVGVGFGGDPTQRPRSCRAETPSTQPGFSSNQTLLIPIDLKRPLGERSVIDLGGKPIEDVSNAS